MVFAINQLLFLRLMLRAFFAERASLSRGFYLSFNPRLESRGKK
jgi:hypothetical protein